MNDRYTARIDGAIAIAEDASYAQLLHHVVRFTVEAAVARSADAQLWTHDELRQNGLSALDIMRNGKAIWNEVACFQHELEEARRLNSEDEFLIRNDLDPRLRDQLDRDLRQFWRGVGYEVPSLCDNMKCLFAELERDAGEWASEARAAFIDEILHALPP